MTLRSPVRHLAAALFLTALIAGCKGGGTTPIKTLLDNPGQYDRQTVRITGTVTRTLGVLGYGAYQVDDGTAGIAVVAEQNGAPREGAKVGVEGEFRSAFTLGSTTAAAIIEHSRTTQ
jgi:hypothetical protein